MSFKRLLCRYTEIQRLNCRSYASIASKTARRKPTKRGTTDFTSRDSILHKDVGSFLAKQSIALEKARVPEHLIHRFLYAKEREDVLVKDVEIFALTSEGDGLGLVSRSEYDDRCTDTNIKTVIKLPKTVPGDLVTALLKRHHDYYAEAELVGVSRKGKGARNDRLKICSHFDLCSGCQFQMISYDDQLQFKEKVIKRAFRYFYPGLDAAGIDNFATVVESPMQFSYRTKLTPHTFIPRKIKPDFLPAPVGFNNATAGKPIVDITHCPIATEPINAMFPVLKKQLNDNLAKKLESNSSAKVASDFILRDSIRIDHATGEFDTVCLTKRSNVVTEKVQDFVFQFEANEFFQNNRSILPTFIDFISYHLSQVKFKYLVDAYCGSGLLGISLSKELPDDGKVFGIEISTKAIEYAQHNAGINGIASPEKIEFVSGNSDTMFTNERFLESVISGEDSVVIMNPSRKGSTDVFIKQLMEFGPKAIVYVSCNVFTQARDLASLQEFADQIGVKYRVKSVTGFDFYPQTKHVESVAILERVT